MDLDIRPLPGYLRVEIRDRKTAKEARSALAAALTAVRDYASRAVLVVTRDSRPIFKVHEYGLEEAMDAAPGLAGLRVAFLPDTPEMQAEQEYIEVLARQRGVEARVFRDERSAVRWLLDKT